MRRLVDLEQPALADQKTMYRVENDERKWIRVTIDFLDQVAIEIEQSANKEISAGRLFEYIAERSKKEDLLNAEQCDLVLPYLEAGETTECGKRESSGGYEIIQ